MRNDDHDNSAQINPEAGNEALREHVTRSASEARLRYGFYIDYDTVLKMLSDPKVVRHSTSICFEGKSLEPGEFAFAQPLGEAPVDGFRLVVHPWFEDQTEILPLLISYHIPSINYGPVATAEHAELFGATLLGLDVDAYYQALCELADSIPTGVSG